MACGLISIKCEGSTIVIKDGNTTLAMPSPSVTENNGVFIFQSGNIVRPVDYKKTKYTVQGLWDLILNCSCCEEEEVVVPNEKLYPYNYEIPTGSTVTLADVMASASAALGIAFKGVASVDFDLKPLKGHFIDLTLSTTSDANEVGPHGPRNLDGGGSSNMSIEYDSFTPIIYRRINTAQAYTAVAGSAAILKIEFIY